jgi:hypothetical protein
MFNWHPPSPSRTLSIHLPWQDAHTATAVSMVTLVWSPRRTGAMRTWVAFCAARQSELTQEAIATQHFQA